MARVTPQVGNEANDLQRAVAFGCSATGCGEIATIMVESGVNAERPYCPVHWQAVRVQSPVPRSCLRILDRPPCFRLDCLHGAVTLMSHVDGTLLPLCEEHLDDLSWVVPTSEELVYLGADDD